jgi:hypothetical protein
MRALSLVAPLRARRACGASFRALSLACCLLASVPALATPSTVIWIPSVDLQPFLSFHLDSDIYFRTRAEPSGSTRPPCYVIGLMTGVLPWEKLQLELGFDLIFQGATDYDRYPIYFHAKLGLTEDALFKWSPAIAAGAYNLGVKSDLTTQNIGYALVGRTLPYLGRLQLGYFYAHEHLFRDEQDRAAHHGFLAAWDRTLKEISPKLWLAVDYQGSMSWIGAVSFAVSWNFTDNISLLLGYDLYVNRKQVEVVQPDGKRVPTIVPGRDTITVQLDIDFESLRKARPAAPAPAPTPSRQ